MSKSIRNIIIAVIILCLLLVIASTGNDPEGIKIIIIAFSLLLFFVGRSIIGQFISFRKSAHKKKNTGALSLKLIVSLMGFFFVTGTILYVLAFVDASKLIDETGYKSHDFNNLEILLRSMFCSLDLFTLDIDTNLLDTIKKSPLIKTLLSVNAILSFACTVIMLLNFAITRLKAYFKLSFLTKINNSRNHLYLFWGINKPSKLLIDEIKRNDPKALSIIIDVADVNDGDTDEWDSIVGLATHKRHVFQLAEDMRAYVAIADQQIADLNNNNTVGSDAFDAFGALSLSRVKTLIKRLEKTQSPKLNIFFLDDDEDLNIRNIRALANDVTIRSIAGTPTVEHCIYCHARQNGPNSVIQDVALKKRINIRIVDSSHIAVESLKMRPDLHPVRVVKVNDDNPTCIDTPLKTLIIGFGEVGRDAFRFLYEFGAFVDSGQGDYRSPFECVIVDKDLDNIKGTFKSAMPGIFSSQIQHHNVSVDFCSTDINGERFYTDVLKPDFLKSLNYIVIALNKADESIQLATRIFSKVRQARADLSDLRILVRCSDDSKLDTVQKIADHYNHGYGDGVGNLPVINIFGYSKSIYTYDLVISDRLLAEGREFHKKYQVVSGEKETWEERHHRYVATEVPNIEKLRSLRRKESQDMANALHGSTKMQLFKRAMRDLYAKRGKEINWTDLYARYFNADGTVNIEGRLDDIRYPGLDVDENRIIRNLAMLEHIRWVAAQELLGYTYNSEKSECNERTLQHNCLCPWSQLDIESKLQNWPCDYKLYDYCVVDATLAIHRDDLLSEMNA